MQVERLVIVGVGLIGGSVGLAAKGSGLARHVVGVGRDERNLQRAQSLGAIDSYATSNAVAALEADLIVICTPVDRVAEDVLACAAVAPARALVTDVGSTKGNILSALAERLPMQGATFIGSHPLAGSEKRGAAHARADLFRDRLVVVTPTAETDTEATAFIELFWAKLGARTIRMEPGEHDRALARTSHVPHAVASALAAITPVGWLNLTAGGFRDTTRIAAGDPELWAAIFEANREAVLDGVQQFAERLHLFEHALQHRDHAALVRWLSEGKRTRDALGS